jgi:UDP-2,3-diacylglucosamine pyrophosphatase LpxH
MFTLDPISKVLRRAQEIFIDDTSKIVMMSDCHRGDGGYGDAFSNNEILYYAALYKYNRRKFTYIELGDGDELWENKRFGDIVPVYRDVFKLLSQFHRDGRLHLLYGNHDIEKRDIHFYEKNKVALDRNSKREVALFPGLKVHEGLVLRHKKTGQEILLVHGHQVDLLNGPFWRVSRFLVRHIWRPLELIGVNDPTGTSKDFKWKHKVERRLAEWSAEKNQMLIAGHTHTAAFPNCGAPPYFNDGCCVHPRSVTALEIENGSIALVEWSYKTRDDGTLYVGRDVLAGPRDLESFLTLNQESVSTASR